MKNQVVFFLLTTVLLSVQAVPLRSTWYKLARASQVAPSDFWKNCGHSGDHAKIMTSSVKINPDPPKRGPISVAGNFTLDEEVLGGTVAINLKIDNIQFYNENLDLCDTALQVGLSCPLAVGSHTLNINQNIPDEAPPGKYDGTVKVTDQNNQELACVSAMFTFS